MDRNKFALLEALKVAATDRGELRLYRRGKLPGLFVHRTRSNAEIANQAVKDGLLEVTRVEASGKATVEWVRITPKGLDYLLESESPVRALLELGEALAANQDGLPTWAAQMQARIDAMAQSFNADVVAMRRQLESLSHRVIEAIDRLEAAHAPMPVPWTQEMLDFLQRRQQVGLGTRCPLEDLFASLRANHTALTIKEFHAGLKHLRDDGTIALMPSVPNGDSSAPEYALLDGVAVYYYVAPASRSESRN